MPARVTPSPLPPGTRPGRRKGVAFSPQATTRIRCNDRAGAQVETQRSLTGVSSFSQKAPFASSCADTKVLLRFRKPNLIHHQSRHLHKIMLELSEPYHGALQWWEKPFGIFRKQEGRHLRLFPHDKWHSGSSVAAVPTDKRVSSGKTRSAGLLKIGHHGETRGRVSATPVPVADAFSPNCVEAQEPFGQVPRG